MRRKCQYSIEYIFTIGMGLIILLMFLVVYYNNERISRIEVEHAQNKLIGDRIVTRIRELSSSSGYALSRLEIDAPPTVKTIYVENNILVINHTRGQDIFIINESVVDLMDHQKALTTIYVIRDTEGQLLLCSNTTCGCTRASCCSSGLCGIGICSSGYYQCAGGVNSVCLNEVMPQPEIPNGLDDDCDGLIDNSACNNGADDDGDGLIDFPADPGCTDASDNDETDVMPAFLVMGLIGHWRFDGNLLDDTGTNDAYACTAVNFDSSRSPAPTVNQPPDFAAEGVRSFIRLSNAGNRNCAVIDDMPIYHLPVGTVSFWMRYRGDASVDGIIKNIIGKDARNCDIRTSLTDVADVPRDAFGNPVPADCNPWPKPGNPDCDCGHLVFRYKPPTFSYRFQNDGNSDNYELESDPTILSVNGDWNNIWHLVTLSFNQSQYSLYIDGVLHDTMSVAADPDGVLEGLTGNNRKLWIGSWYPDEEVPPAPAVDRLLNSDVDIDDLRIYDRALNQTSIQALLIWT